MSPLTDHKDITISSNASSPEKHKIASIIRRISPKVMSMPKVFLGDDKNNKNKKTENTLSVHWGSGVVEKEEDTSNISLLQKIQNNLQKFAQKKNYDVVTKGRRGSSTDVVHPRILIPKEGMSETDNGGTAEDDSDSEKNENDKNHKLPFMISKPNLSSQLKLMIPKLQAQKYLAVKTEESDSEINSSEQSSLQNDSEQLPCCREVNGVRSGIDAHQTVHESKSSSGENVCSNCNSNSMIANAKECHHVSQASHNACMASGQFLTEVNPERDKRAQPERYCVSVMWLILYTNPSLLLVSQPRQ